MNTHPLRTKRTALGLFIFVILTAVDLRPCTLAVCSGKATRDGRPLMWKNRDTSSVDNKVLSFSGATYKFLGLVDAGGRRGVPGQACFVGLRGAQDRLPLSQLDRTRTIALG